MITHGKQMHAHLQVAVACYTFVSLPVTRLTLLDQILPVTLEQSRGLKEAIIEAGTERESVSRPGPLFKPAHRKSYAKSKRTKYSNTIHHSRNAPKPPYCKRPYSVVQQGNNQNCRHSGKSSLMKPKSCDVQILVKPRYVVYLNQNTFHSLWSVSHMSVIYCFATASAFMFACSTVPQYASTR